MMVPPPLMSGKREKNDDIMVMILTVVWQQPNKHIVQIKPTINKGVF